MIVYIYIYIYVRVGFGKVGVLSVPAISALSQCSPTQNPSVQSWHRDSKALQLLDLSCHNNLDSQRENFKLFGLIYSVYPKSLKVF